MSSDRAVRKLAAILAADVVGYSRLIEKDEARTLAALRKLRVSVFDPLVAENRGRIVKLMGDGILVEFNSAVDAVVCATAIQGRIASEQPDSASSPRIVFRIGINLGDVALDGDDLMGDGVNVAARLEQLCEPGGVVISGTIYDQMQGRFELPLDFMGEQKVKNISRAVRVYRVRLDGKGPALTLRYRSMRRRAPAIVGLVALAALRSLTGLWWRTHVGKALESPSVAVMPFENFGPSADGRLVDGLTEDIVADLARNGSFLVISSAATRDYKGSTEDFASIQRSLKVRYILKGSVQRASDRIKVNARLLDATSGADMWSERYDRPSSELFDVQGEIADRVATWLYWTVASTEKAAARRKRPADLNAWEFYLLAADKIGIATDTNIGEVESLLLRAIALDPNLSRAYSLLSNLYVKMSVTAQNPEALQEKAAANARRAIELDPLDALGYAALGEALCSKGNFDSCKLEFDKALHLSPGSFELLAAYCGWASSLGAAKEGAEAADQAIRSYPSYPPFAAHSFPYAFMMVGRYEDAIKAASRLPPESRTAFDYLIYASSLALAGRVDEARPIVAAGVAAFPAQLSIEGQTSRNDWAPHELPLVVEGMRKAGFPVCTPAKDSSGAAVPPPEKRLAECTIDRSPG